TSCPGQPGTAPSAPRWPRSTSEASDTIWSASPRIHSTSGRSATSANPDTSQNFGEIALFTPRSPGAVAGRVVVVPDSHLQHRLDQRVLDVRGEVERWLPVQRGQHPAGRSGIVGATVARRDPPHHLGTGGTPAGPGEVRPARRADDIAGTPEAER